MIDINLTIACQMAHFLVAFWLMRRFLWRPVIAVVDRKAKQQEELERQLKEQQAQLVQKQVEIDQAWRDAQRAFLANTPTLKRTICLKTFTRRQPAGCPFQATDAVVTSMAQDLIKKVHAHGQ